MNLVTDTYYDKYLNESSKVIDWRKVDDWATKSVDSKFNFNREDFSFYAIASSLYSSKIEGNSLDIDSFFTNRGKKSSPKKKEVKDIEVLVKAYEFAYNNPLNKKNALFAHGILSEGILPKKERGRVRTEKVGVRDSSSALPIYLAVEPEYVKEEFNKLFKDIDTLLKKGLSIEEVFFYASLIHLWFVKIHPFTDGNGRTARLLEKWFIASKIGDIAWSINPEKYYWDNRQDYYDKVAVGYNYYNLKWERSVPFALMLVEVLKAKKNK